MLSHTLTMRDSDVASLVEFRGDSVTDRWTDDGLKEKRVALENLYYKGK